MNVELFRMYIYIPSYMTTILLQVMLMFTPKMVSWNHNGFHHRQSKVSHARKPTLPYAPSSTLRTPKTYSLPPEKIEVFKSLEGWASQCILPLVKPVEQSWQPVDFLPDSSLPVEDFNNMVRDLRDRAAELPDDYLVVLVGDMITEEAVPTYQTRLNQLDGVADKTGSCTSPWAVWSRAWTAEENRHGDLLQTYLYLSGRVDMRMIDRTIHYLIAAGMKWNIDKNPYMGFVYTSFQERATFISHGNTARLAKKNGDPVLARICGTIAADEKRHENAYVKIVEKLLEVDPTETMVAISNMMRKGITMPALLMQDGKDPHLFDHFSAVAQRLGVYTAADYADILEFLIQRWKLEKIQDLTSEGRRAQDFVCGLAPRIRRLQERADERARKTEPHSVKFSWIFNKEVPLI